jgi:hypothetical protein
MKPSLWSRWDWLIAVAMIVVGIAVGNVSIGSFTRAGNKPQFYQAQFGPAALWACGRGFVNPPTPAIVLDPLPGYLRSNTPAPGFESFSAFLRGERNSFDCGELPSSFAAEPPVQFQGTARYLLMLAAIVWSVSGISWPALNVIGPIFGGLTAACIYLLARTGMGRLLAGAIAMLWVTSPLQLSQMPHGAMVGPFTQLSAFARMRAVEVFPIPRGPTKR